MHMIAFAKDEKERWKHTSMISFNVARFGNSDPKRFPSSIKKYMPLLWDDGEDDEENDPLINAARQRRLKPKVDG